MDSTASGACHKLPRPKASPGGAAVALAGDVDGHGEIVDELRLRLRAAIGDCISTEIDPDKHVALTLELIAAGRTS